MRPGNLRGLLSKPGGDAPRPERPSSTDYFSIRITPTATSRRSRSGNFDSRRLRLIFRLERPGRRSELTFDVLEQQPMLDDLHQKVIAWAAARKSARYDHQTVGQSQKEKAQLAPGLHNHSRFGVARLYHNGHESSLSGRNGPAMMASGIVTSKSRSHFTHLTN